MIFCQHDNGVIEVFNQDAYQLAHPSADIGTCRLCLRSWDDTHVSSMTPAPAGGCPFGCDLAHVAEHSTEGK